MPPSPPRRPRAADRQPGGALLGPLLGRPSAVRTGPAPPGRVLDQGKDAAGHERGGPYGRAAPGELGYLAHAAAGDRLDVAPAPGGGAPAGLAGPAGAV